MKMLGSLVAAAICGAVFAGNSLGECKIAVIDIEKIVKLHPNTESDKKLLEETLKDYTSQTDALEAAALSARKAFEAAAQEMRNPALGEKARKRAEDDAKAKFEAARNAEQAAVEKKRELQRSLTEQEVRMLRRTLDAIEDAVAAYAKSKGLSAVLPSSGSKLGIAPAVVWHDEALDVTGEIMAALKIEEPKAEAEGEAK